MKSFLGFITVTGIGVFFWLQNPQATPWILGIGGLILGFLIFAALICYGISMLRLFLKM